MLRSFWSRAAASRYSRKGPTGCLGGLADIRQSNLIIRGQMKELSTVNDATKSAEYGRKLDEIRKLLRNDHLDAIIVPCTDAHMSEDVAECDRRLKWLCGFSGSAGTAVVTLNEALLWTDGRYYEQASQELTGSWKLIRGSDPGVKSIPNYLRESLGDSKRIGVSAEVVSAKTAHSWTAALDGSSGSARTDIDDINKFFASKETCLSCSCLVPIRLDFVDQLWGNDMPERPCSPLQSQSLALAGQRSQEKIDNVRNHLSKSNLDCIIFNGLDEIAWLLNLRGRDTIYTPVFFSYLIVSREKVVLIVQQKVNDAAKELLNDSVEGIVIESYSNKSEVFGTLSKYCFSEGDDLLRGNDQKILSKTPSLRSVSIDPASLNWLTVLDLLENENVKLVFEESPVKRAKAIKNEIELNGMRQAHILEGVSLCRFYAWIEAEIECGRPVDECSAASKLEEIRKMSSSYWGPSFESISAYGPNGSVIHYSPTPETNRVIGSDSLYLLDTGGQYDMGTTDMTRTVCFGEPTEFQKLAFSLVLEGQVALAKSRFPDFIEPAKLDVVARYPLWRAGLDYRHGTSHGVGSFLGVHEYPPLIHSGLPTASMNRENPSPTSMTSCMVLSNEPGYYQPGEFGIRIENMMISKDCTSKLPMAARYSESAKWIDFETITLVPVQAKLIEVTVVSSETLEWVNTYHKQCLEILSPYLREENDRKALEWLQKNCLPI